MNKGLPAMRRLALTTALLCGALFALTGCLSTFHILPEPQNGQVQVFQADREAVWAALIRLLENRNIQIVELNRDQGSLRTDFIYFRPMDFGEKVLEGAMMMGEYVDVQGGRYRLTVQVTPADAATSVRVEAELQRLEKRAGETAPIEPSFSLDSSASRGYVVGVPQPSNGVIERHFLREMEQEVAGKGASAPADTDRLSNEDGYNQSGSGY